MSTTNIGLFSLMTKIDGMSNQFTKTDWEIVQYIKTDLDEFLKLSAKELAKKLKISDASIIRFTQKVGYSGLSEFKYIMQKELSKGTVSANHTDYASLMQDYKVMTETLFNLVDASRIDTLREAMLTASNIYIIGMDANRSVAEMMAHKFLLCGLPVHATTTYDMMKLYTSVSKPEDLFIVITLSGDHKKLASYIGSLISNGSKVAVISNYEKSICSAYADLVIPLPKTDLLRCSESVSREIFTIMLFDMLFMSILNEDAESLKAFNKTASFARNDDEI